MKIQRSLAWALGACYTVASLCDAATIYVDQNFSGTSTGSLSQPFTDLQVGIDNLNPGDTLIIQVDPDPANNDYLLDFGEFVINALDNVTIRAEEPGAIRLIGSWQAAFDGSLGWTETEDAGVWRSNTQRTTYAGNQPTSMAGSFTHDGVDYYLFALRDYVDLRDQLIPTNGVPDRNIPYGFYAEESGEDAGRYFVRLPTTDPDGNALDLNPNDLNIHFARKALNSNNNDLANRAIFRIRNSENVTIEGIQFIGAGSYGILARDDSPGLVVRNCVFELANIGVSIPQNTQITWCEHVYPGFAQFNEDLMAANLGLGGANDIFDIVKKYPPKRIEGGLYAASALVTEGGVEVKKRDREAVQALNCEFSYNFIHQVFDGEQFGTTSDSVSHHNVYINVMDNAVQFDDRGLTQDARNLALHHSYIEGYAFGPLSHQVQFENDLEGPHYVYRCVLNMSRVDFGRSPVATENAWNPIWMLKTQIGLLADESPEIGYYHNTLITDKSTFFINSFNGIPLQNFTMMNNIIAFSDRQGNVDGPLNNATPTTTFDYNLTLFQDESDDIDGYITGPNGLKIDSTPIPGPEDGAAAMQAGRDANLALLGLADPTVTGRQWQPLAESAAINAAVDLPDDLRAALPGLQETTFLDGGTYDVGAFELGQTAGPDWPRPHQRAFSDAFDDGDDGEGGEGGIPPDDALNLWTMENSGADLGSSNNPLTLVGNAEYTAVDPLEGSFSLALDGGGDYAIARNYAGVTGSAARTVSGWIKTADDGCIIGWGTVATDEKFLVRIDGGRLRLEITGDFMIGTTNLTDDQWRHIAVVVPAAGGAPTLADVILYVDGVVEPLSQTGTRAINTGNDIDVTIGRNMNFRNRYFRGQIDELRIYDRALTGAEVNDLANGTGGGTGGEGGTGGGEGGEGGEGGIPTDDALNLWTMENTGADLGSSNNPLTLFGNAQYTSSDPLEGSFSLDLGGGGDYARAINHFAVTGTNARTVAGWIKTSGNGCIIGWGGTANGTRFLIRIDQGKLRLEIAGAAITGTADLRDNQWRHIAVVVPSGGFPRINEVTLYVDGVVDPLTLTNDRPINTGTEIDVTIGRNMNINSRFFNGQIDELRIYDRALTAAEVSDLASTTP